MYFSVGCRAATYYSMKTIFILRFDDDDGLLQVDTWNFVWGITNMATVRKSEVTSDKFNVDRICT